MKAIIRVTAAAMVLAVTLAHAGFPSWYPKDGFERWGKIDDFRTEDAAIVIGDMYYRFPDNLVVHSLSQYSDSIARVRKGATVGYFVDQSASGQRIVRELWLLPDNYTQPGH